MKKLSLALLAMATALTITPAALADSISFYLTQPENGGAALSDADSVEVIVTDDQVIAGVCSVASTTCATVEFIAATAGANEGKINAPVALNVSGEFSATSSAGLAPGSPCGGNGYTGDAHNCAAAGGGFGTMDLETGAGSPATITIDLTAEGSNSWADAADVLVGTTTKVANVEGWEAFDGAAGTQYGGYATVTPEPSSLVLLGTGLLGLAFVAFRRAKASGLAF